jgi:hypothetical protein
MHLEASAGTRGLAPGGGRHGSTDDDACATAAFVILAILTAGPRMGVAWAFAVGLDTGTSSADPDGGSSEGGRSGSDPGKGDNESRGGHVIDPGSTFSHRLGSREAGEVGRAPGESSGHDRRGRRVGRGEATAPCPGQAS